MPAARRLIVADMTPEAASALVYVPASLNVVVTVSFCAGVVRTVPVAPKLPSSATVVLAAISPPPQDPRSVASMPSVARFLMKGR